ncbi:hypothetical protein DM01DRAFT_1333778 [Hesseltinella vesiculosa]|uniref:HTH APSES-type domain-containing protein n=1 Tax=Hesseltinella vesiculosa TaxID=101127 RepID=A0A1X2GNQ9_9FUNG|nr:hypothetical protein DM01DRAFT_1333778 [Hesseltinella vesiculosa]
MMQHTDHTNYYPSYRPTANNSAFSDPRSYLSSTSRPASSTSNPIASLTHSPPLSHSTASTVSSTSTNSMLGWSSPGLPALPWTPISSAVRPSSSCFSLASPMQRPKLTTTVWEDENTVCYQVDAKSVCVARRQDNDMINGTKLLNVVGMSRGKRDGILKNEKGRVVVKVGAMHLKGVWITFERAKDLAAKFKIEDLLYPLFTDDPSIYLCPSAIPGTTAVPTSSMLPSSQGMPMVVPSTRIPPPMTYRHDHAYGYNLPTWDRSSDNNDSLPHQDTFATILRGHPEQPDLPSGSCSPVPGTIAPLMPPTTTSNASTTLSTNQNHDDLYLMNSPYDYRSTAMSMPPRSSTYDTFDYDPLSRKSYMKSSAPTTTSSTPTYPDSPPHEDIKYNPLSHHTPLTSQWHHPSTTSTPLPPPSLSSLSALPHSLTPKTKDDLSITQRGRKRSLQQTVPELPCTPDVKPVKKLRTQH